jgi:hypothetical protein
MNKLPELKKKANKQTAKLTLEHQPVADCWDQSRK